MKMNNFIKFICGIFFGISFIWTICAADMVKRYYPVWNILESDTTTKMLVFVAFVVIGIFLMTISAIVFKGISEIDERR